MSKRNVVLDTQSKLANEYADKTLKEALQRRSMAVAYLRSKTEEAREAIVREAFEASPLSRYEDLYNSFYEYFLLDVEKVLSKE